MCRAALVYCPGCKVLVCITSDVLVCVPTQPFIYLQAVIRVPALRLIILASYAVHSACGGIILIVLSVSLTLSCILRWDYLILWLILNNISHLWHSLYNKFVNHLHCLVKLLIWSVWKQNTTIVYTLQLLFMPSSSVITTP